MPHKRSNIAPVVLDCPPFILGCNVWNIRWAHQRINMWSKDHRQSFILQREALSAPESQKIMQMHQKPLQTDPLLPTAVFIVTTIVKQRDGALASAIHRTQVANIGALTPFPPLLNIQGARNDKESNTSQVHHDSTQKICWQRMSAELSGL